MNLGGGSGGGMNPAGMMTGMMMGGAMGNQMAGMMNQIIFIGRINFMPHAFWYHTKHGTAV